MAQFPLMVSFQLNREENGSRQSLKGTDEALEEITMR